jgi:hypothetical protein
MRKNEENMLRAHRATMGGIITEENLCRKINLKKSYRFIVPRWDTSSPGW